MLFEFARLSPRERHKILISTVVPRPIAWVVTEDERSELNLAPFSFFNVFAEDPPLICLGIGIGEQRPDERQDGVRQALQGFDRGRALACVLRPEAGQQCFHTGLIAGPKECGHDGLPDARHLFRIER